MIFFLALKENACHHCLSSLGDTIQNVVLELKFSEYHHGDIIETEGNLRTVGDMLFLALSLEEDQKVQELFLSTMWLWLSISEEISSQEKLYTTSTVLKMIIEKRICTCVKMLVIIEKYIVHLIFCSPSSSKLAPSNLMKSKGSIACVNQNKNLDFLQLSFTFCSHYRAVYNSRSTPLIHWPSNLNAIESKVVTRKIEPLTATLPALSAVKKKLEPARKAAEDKYPRSFLKWAGGKYSVLDEILAVMPAGKRLIEPFVGSGTVFINAGFKRNLLGDINPDLINLFNQLQGNPDTVINTAHQLEKSCLTNEAYVAMRNEFNGRQAHAVRHAALFLALMRTCFNGLCRYNLKGLFNVGWNKKAGANYFPLDELQHFAGLQKEMTFICAGFEEVIGQAGEGDVIFCDPPYEPMLDENGFTAYSGNAFTFEHQTRLVECLVAARKRGAKVVITNSSAPSVVDLYTRNGFRIMPLAARRSVSCKGDTRKTADDIIAVL